MPEIKALICMPTSSEGYVVPGSLPAQCSKCRQPVWVAPSSWLIKQDTPDIVILCIPCSLAQMKKDNHFKIEDLTPAQAEEIEGYHRRGGN